MSRFKIPIINFGLLFTAVIISLLLVEVILRIIPSVKIFYRPHEKLQYLNTEINLGLYRSNEQLNMIMDHGDLVALSRNEVDFDIETREVNFRVDSIGFRNDSDYNNGTKFILVGDSFIVGCGNSQENILSAQLKRDYNLDTYNVAWPGGIKEYLGYIDYFQNKYQADIKILLFLFEGNDFPTNPSINDERDKENIRARISRVFWHPLLRWVRRCYFFRFPMSLYYRQRKEYVSCADVVTYRIDGHKVGFLAGHIAVTTRERYDGTKWIEPILSSLKNEIESIYFIPTKYRVYYDMMPKEPEHPQMSNVQWEYLDGLCNRLHIRCINLTNSLVSESKKLLIEQNALTWWKDDTHWNKHGISIAAKTVYKSITEVSQIPDSKRKSE